MADYTFTFWAFLALCCSVTYRSSDHYKKHHQTQQQMDKDNESALSEEEKLAHTKLLKKYLFVYLMATFSDWLQGPYVYALYSDYGFDQHEIAKLFVAGFGSSMIFGSFVGGIADQGGRRLFVIIFAAVYLASCLTKREYGVWHRCSQLQYNISISSEAVVKRFPIDSTILFHLVSIGRIPLDFLFFLFSIAIPQQQKSFSAQHPKFDSIHSIPYNNNNNSTK